MSQDQKDPLLSLPSCPVHWWDKAVPDGWVLESRAWSNDYPDKPGWATAKGPGGLVGVFTWIPDDESSLHRRYSAPGVAELYSRLENDPDVRARQDEQGEALMADEKKCTRGFEVTALAPLEDGSTLGLSHHEDHRFRLGVIRPRKDGEPLPVGARLVKRGEDGLYRAPPLGHEGPGLVNSAAYREGWGRIFGGRQEIGKA